MFFYWKLVQWKQYKQVIKVGVNFFLNNDVKHGMGSNKGLLCFSIKENKIQWTTDLKKRFDQTRNRDYFLIYSDN